MSIQIIKPQIINTLSTSEDTPTVAQMKFDYGDGQLDRENFPSFIADFKIYLTAQGFNLFYNTDKQTIFAVPTAKRGNRQYGWKVKKKFDEWKRLKPLHRLKQKKGYRTTNILHCSNTYAWRSWETFLRISDDTNLFLANIRKQYGKIEYLRVYETQKDGTAHVHLLILFLEYDFKLKKNPVGTLPNGHKRKGGWGIYGKSEIAKHWKQGFMDVTAVVNFEKQSNYLSNYLQKSMGSLRERDIESHALQMLFSNQTYHCPSKKRIDELLAEYSPDLKVNSVIQTNQNESYIYLGYLTTSEPIHRKEILGLTYEIQGESYNLSLENLIWCQEHGVPFPIGKHITEILTTPLSETVQDTLTEYQGGKSQT